MKSKILSILIMIVMIMFVPQTSFAVQENQISNGNTSLILATPKKLGRLSIKLAWDKVDGAKKYDVYAARCGNKMKKIATTKGTKVIIKKVSGRKLVKHGEYKMRVVAYSEGKRIAQSRYIHYILGNTHGKYANAKSISINNIETSMEKGETYIVNAKAKVKKGKRHINSNHGAAIKCYSSRPEIIGVSKNTMLIAKESGTATIYAVDIGGGYKKIEVKVKTTEVNDAGGTSKTTKHTITFNNNGHGKPIENQIVEHGSKATKPIDLKDAKYAFCGWFDNEVCTGDAFSFDTEIMEDKILYAKWELKIPEKGELIKLKNMSGTYVDIDGIDGEDIFTVVNIDENKIEVLATNGKSMKFNSTNALTNFTASGEADMNLLQYAGSDIDKYLNGESDGCYYGEIRKILGSETIIKKTIDQGAYEFHFNERRMPKTTWKGEIWNKVDGKEYIAEFLGTYGINDSGYKSSVGERYVYALDIKDITDYLDTFYLNNLFFNTEYLISRNCWLRSACSNDGSQSIYSINGAHGCVFINENSTALEARAAFTIDLLKCDYESVSF